MGARGPKPDADQAAKGNPGRRKGKAKAAAAQAARIVELLAPVENAAADLPAMLQDPKYAPAAQIWRRLAPELRRTNRLPIESEFYFVQVCVYAQEWVESTENLHTKGFTQAVQTVAGGTMERRRPATFDRQQAFSNLQQLAPKFGLTPHDMYELFKGQAAAAVTRPDLFGGSRQVAVEAEPTSSEGGRIGGLASMRSPPPASRPN